MQTNKVKPYAQQARRDFIKAVTRRAARFGLTAKGIAPNRAEGELVIIEGQAYPRAVGAQRQRLAERIRREGFEAVMEAVAYTWFNRLLAIRYMELHGYLDHSYRVLSHPANGSGSVLPEILEQAQHLDLPGLDRERVIALKLDGTQDEALYRELLLAQCRALHRAMPFLFEALDDETELLLPERLLHTDSVIRALVERIPEADWQQIEIIGWLYQFYISEKKDQVIGKVVKSEDIPAATQLFTPNWIVKYLVQNSLGAQWLATYPGSPLKAQMDYYIEPAEQTPEVQAQLDAITPKHLDPEQLTLIDPACGSGHILVEAYDLLKAIYTERGYRLRDIPKLILEQNLYGLDIDPRAAQLAGFALMMKGRGDDRRLLERGVVLNVLAFEEVGSDEWLVVSGGEVVSDEWLVDSGFDSRAALRDAVAELAGLFRHARTFGSLIQVPETLAAQLPQLRRLCETAADDFLLKDALARLAVLVRQAEVLARRYDAVVANPPYMAAKGMEAGLRRFVAEGYRRAKADLFAAFLARASVLAGSPGFVAMVTMHSWMFLASFEKLRSWVLANSTLRSMIHLGARAFSSISGEIVQTAAFSLHTCPLGQFESTYFRLVEGAEEEKRRQILERSNGFQVKQESFLSIPGTPISYWLGKAGVALFANWSPLGKFCDARVGLLTSDNDQFLRYWWEVSLDNICFNAATSLAAQASRKRWFPHNKGGEYRKWWGNQEFVVDWEDSGRRIKEAVVEKYPYLDGDPNFVVHDDGFYFRPSVSWSEIGTGSMAFRAYPTGFTFNIKGMSAFCGSPCSVPQMLSLCNSAVMSYLSSALNPSISFGVKSLTAIPAVIPQESCVKDTVIRLVQLAKRDWIESERSWSFRGNNLVAGRRKLLEEAFREWRRNNLVEIAEAQDLERLNNERVINAAGLQFDVSPEVPVHEITLKTNPAYRYSKPLSDQEWSVEVGFPEDLETRFREDTMRELVSYAVGCMMGRYAVDRAGLIYAHAHNDRFWEVYGVPEIAEKAVAGAGDSSVTVGMFPPDGDGIVPITDTDWFDDDATHRLVEFIAKAWGSQEVSEEVASEKVVSEEDSPLTTNHYPLSTSSLPTNHYPLTTSSSPLTTNHYPLSTSSSPLSTSSLDENLKFLADNLSPKRGESPRDTIRRYFADGFFKDHLKTYKKRPIYWCFSSGKQKAFQCLVYLHRYHEGTLARMRMEYVVPLQSKMAARIDTLADEIPTAASASRAKTLQKARDKLIKQLEELRRFDEQLRHYADQRIALDLDDGVKVNYGKFGDLLAEVKAVTGKSADE